MDATGMSGVFDGRMMPALGEPVRVRGVKESTDGCCDPGTYPACTTPGGWYCSGITGAEVVMTCVLDVDCDKDSWPSVRGGGAGLV